MRVLIFHGYLLAGTGSNVYNANLARTLAQLGHDVHLLCQDRRAGELDWIDAVGEWTGGELQIRPTRESHPGTLRKERGGTVTAYVPEIGGLLPTYVADEYEGFASKTFPEMTDAELEHYIDANVAAVRDVAAGGVDAALANHLVMGPLICARAGLRFAAKVHGSALSYTVGPNPRFLSYAREGIAAASCVLVGSHHTAQQLLTTLDDPALAKRTRLGQPGVNVREFVPRERRIAVAALASLAVRLDAERGGEEFGRDSRAAAAALSRFAGSPGPRVLYVGKLIGSKGVDLLLAAWPLIARENPGATLLLGGFGGFRDDLERLWREIEAGDLAAARAIALRGPDSEGTGRRPTPLQILAGFLDAPPAGYREAASAAAGSVVISGRLTHSEVADVMPAADVLVMPSTFPEAFGMVAAEAAACGVPPVSASHSGMLEVSKVLAEGLPPELAPLLSFDIGPNAVNELAQRIGGWLRIGIVDRREAGRAMSAIVGERWSWERVARGVIAASRGELEALPPA